MDREKVIKGLEYAWEYIRERPNPTAFPKAMAMDGIKKGIAMLKEQESNPDKCIICEGCGHKLQDNWNLCPWCGCATKRGRRYGF